MLEVGREGREARTFLHLMLTGEMHAGTSEKKVKARKKNRLLLMVVYYVS